MSRIFDEDLRAGFGTRAVHAGQRPDPSTGAIMTPIFQTSTYAQDGLGLNKGYEYARGKNPTREALERNIASLEGGRHGFAFSSGMGCLDSIMKLFKAGDEINVTGWLARDGGDWGHSREVMFKDGKKLFFGPPAGTGDGGAAPVVPVAN